MNPFNPLIIEKYQTDTLAEDKPSTVNRRVSCLKAMFKKACDWDWVGEDILKMVRTVKQLKEPPGRLRYLSLEEIELLIESCPSHLKPIVIAAVNTGMRLGEILGLKWEQIDLRNGFILLDRTKNGGRRELPLKATLRETLEAMPHSIESLYVFVNKDGNPYQGG